LRVSFVQYYKANHAGRKIYAIKQAHEYAEYYTFSDSSFLRRSKIFKA
jgi:hypothetical protein